MARKVPWNHDQFEFIGPAPYWIVATNRVGAIVEYKTVEHADARRALVDALAEFSGKGWKPESFDSRHTYFFCNRDGDRRMVSVTATDPTKPRQITVQL
jgi:hypothetical protein